MKPCVVLDTNVYIAFLLGGRGARKLFRLFLLKKFELYTSKLQLAELREVVTRDFGPRGRKPIPARDLADLELVLSRRAHVLPNRRVSKRSPDPDDNWIIGIALKAKADYLVSENRDHVNQEALPESSSTRVVSIARAVKLLGGG